MKYYKEIEIKYNKKLNVTSYSFSRTLTCKTIDDRKFDVTYIKTENELIIILNEVKNNLKEILSKHALTKRETQIAIMKFEERLSNIEICDKLCVSLATVKTHFNNVMKKIEQ
jgi:DNA-binding CsgD family transcriptional regulator